MCNEQIFGWFEQGKIKETLMGEGEYYIHDRDHNIHDRSHVLMWLCKWTETVNKKEKAQKGFLSAVDCLLKSKQLRDVFHLYWLYYNAKFYHSPSLFFDDEILVLRLKSIILEYAYEITSDPSGSIRYYISRIADYVPDIYKASM